MSLEKAINFARRHHFKKKRKTGSPFIEHPLAVRKGAKELKLAETYQIAAVLHDVCEKCDVSISEIEILFGKEVASVVFSLTKDTEETKYIDAISFDLQLRSYIFKIRNESDRHPEVILLKIIDQLDNLNTLPVFPEQKYYRILWTIIFYYLPFYGIFIENYSGIQKSAYLNLVNELANTVQQLLDVTYSENKKCLFDDPVEV